MYMLLKMKIGLTGGRIAYFGPVNEPSVGCHGELPPCPFSPPISFPVSFKRLIRTVCAMYTSIELRLPAPQLY